ncbi:MAG: FkbM family methyltransferase [Planctomycetota bacterium]
MLGILATGACHDDTPSLEQDWVDRLETRSAELTRDWQRWLRRDVDAYQVPEREMAKTFERIAHVLEAIPDPRIHFVDVGCAQGDYLRWYVQPMLQKPLFSVGIDPIDWPERAPYDRFVAKAVTNRDEGQYDFYLYGDGDLACSSLARMVADHVTHDPTQADQKFYHPAAIETAQGKTEVEAVHLATIIEDAGLADAVVHFLKIDIQGTDFAALLSAKQHLCNVFFVQLETICTDAPGGRTLYEDQTVFAAERPVLEELGFRLFNVAAFPAGPEADVTFVNTALLTASYPPAAAATTPSATPGTR